MESVGSSPLPQQPIELHPEPSHFAYTQFILKILFSIFVPSLLRGFGFVYLGAPSLTC